MDLEFYDITFKIKRGWRDKRNGSTILHGISGSFRAGQLTAILGPSGAGKSTLLNILSGYQTEGVEGTFKINGQPLNKKLFHKSSRYITQEDLLPPYLTTKEAMLIATSLKLPKSTTENERKKIVKEILTLLGLQESCNTRTELLSGGQKKRLSIALEMINNPNVFFLDEPTSGLDNVSTTQSLKILKKLAKQERTIICTIHQPSASILELFDNVYFLAGGKCIYQGTTEQLLPFLSSRGFECPTYHNPADFVMDIIDTDSNAIAVMSEAICNGKISHFKSYVSNETQNYQPNEEKKYEETKASICLILNNNDNNNNNNNNYSVNRNINLQSKFKEEKNYDLGDYPRSCFDQFLILVKKMFKQNTRNMESVLILFFHHLLCALLFGSVFYKTANDAYQMFNHLKFCVGYILFHTYTNVMLPVLVYPAEVKLIKKEYFNRWYSLNPYYAALLVTKLPTQIIFGTMFSAIIYFMSGLPAQPLRIALFFIIGIMVIFISDALGMAIGSIFSVTNGAAIGPAIVSPFLGLAVYGFDFAKDVPWFTYSMMKLSFMRCSVIATALTIYGYGRETLECKDIYCHFKEPRLMLNYLDIEHVSVWNELIILCVLLLFFRLIAYFALRNRLLVK